MDKTYKIKNTLRIPMLLAVILSIPVFADLLTKGLPTVQITLIGILIIFFYIMAINNLIRQVVLTPASISIRTYLGTKQIDAADITAVDGIMMGKRQFISLSAAKRHYLIQNSFTDFPGIMDALAGMVPETALMEGFTHMRQFPQIRTGDSIAAWVTVAILAAVLVSRYMPH